jgi:cell division septation protein DedD
MKKTASGSTDLTPTLTPTPKPTPTPTEKPTPTEEPTPTPTPSGEILGEEATPEPEATPSSFSFQNFLPHFFVGLGGLLLAVSGGSFLLPKLKKKYNIRKHGKGEEII